MRGLIGEFEEALRGALARVPLEARLQVTREALAPLGLPEERVEEAALPGAFHGTLYRDLHGYPYRFLRYGNAVLAAGEDFTYPEWGKAQGVWHREPLWKPLARPSLYWALRPTPFPSTLLQGVGEALTWVAWELGLRSRAAPPARTVALFPPAWAEGLVIVPLMLLEVPEDEEVSSRLLVMDQEAAALFDPLPTEAPPEVFRRRQEAWREIRNRYQAILSGEEPAPLPPGLLRTFLEAGGAPST